MAVTQQYILSFREKYLGFVLMLFSTRDRSGLITYGVVFSILLLSLFQISIQAKYSLWYTVAAVFFYVIPAFCFVLSVTLFIPPVSYWKWLLRKMTRVTITVDEAEMTQVTDRGKQTWKLEAVNEIIEGFNLFVVLLPTQFVVIPKTSVFDLSVESFHKTKRVVTAKDVIKKILKLMSIGLLSGFVGFIILFFSPLEALPY